ncbi:MAG: formate dehydrogenase subunit delta [Gammaproteobacteria bacterium]|nr:formate dehydrogenase subunit delta [Gammaproteobacteria bacterium]
MSIDRLLEMANDIAAYFDVERDDAVAIAGIRNHIQRFWEPRMRRKLIEYVARHPAEELTPRARAAVAGLTMPAGREPAGTPAG